MHSFGLVSRIREQYTCCMQDNRENTEGEEKKRKLQELQKVQWQKKNGVVSISCMLSLISLLHKSYIHYPIGIHMIPIFIVSEYSLFFVSLLWNGGVSLYRVLWLQEWVTEINYLTCGNKTSQLQIGKVNKVFFKSNHWFILLPLHFYISQRKSNFFIYLSIHI